MTLGIDIDDVITNTSELIVDYAKKHFNSTDIDLINNILHASNIDDKLVDFYDKYLLEMQKIYTLKENVKEVIDRLILKGHKIVIITARGNNQPHAILGELDQKTGTIEYLSKHQINYNKIIFRARDKKEAAIKNEIDVLIDDSVFILENLKGSNVRPVLFTSISNKNIEANFDRVSNWLELEQYLENLHN